MNSWEEWVKQIPPAEQEKLRAALMSKASGVQVTRIATADLYFKPPPFLDIYGLISLYDSVAFNKNLIIKGPQGVGKSLSVYHWAYERKIPVVVEDCTEDTKKYELKGTQTAVGGDFVYILGSLPAAIDVANEVGRCVLMLEELNALTPNTQKALNPIADFRKRISLPHIGRTYDLREGAQLWVVATMNPSSFSGTFELNPDLRSRFEEVEIGYLPEREEIDLLQKLVNTTSVNGVPISRFVKLAQQTRNEPNLYSLSPRDLVRIVHNAQTLGLPKALNLVMSRANEEDKKLLRMRIEAIFGSSITVKDTWG